MDLAARRFLVALVRNETTVGWEVNRGSRDSSVDNTSKKCGNRWDVKRAAGDGGREEEFKGMCSKRWDVS